MQALLDADNVFRYSRCWRITWADGTTHFDFTEHNAPLTVGGGVGITFYPAGGVDTTAAQFKQGLEAGNAEMRGMVTSDKIKEDDLRGGKFRDATVTEYLVDWNYPFEGYFEQRVYLILNVKWSAENWAAEMVEKSQFMEKPHGRIYTRNCGWQFGDANCGKGLTGNDQSGRPIRTGNLAITATDDTKRKTFTVGSLAAYADDEFNYGRVEFMSGNDKLNGLSLEILDFVASTKVFTLNLPAPFDMDTSTVVRLTQGCAKNKASCETRFNNYKRYGGFPYIPGDDKVRIIPDAPA